MLALPAFFIAAAASCNRDPAIVKPAPTNVSKAYYAQLPGTRIATVAVTLDANGHVTDARIYQSTGDATLDAAAVDAAKRSTFSAAQTNCTPTAGTFAVEFTFVGEKPGPDALDCPHPARVVTATVVRPASWGYGSTEVQVAVEVTIGADGKLVEARIVKSSNNMAMDQAALASARDSTYEPKTIAVSSHRQAGTGPAAPADRVVCKAVEGTYLFRVTYRP
ncbi:MAG TPA: TonB family protein [Candidatus Baltobacteraceae bacterium]